MAILAVTASTASSPPTALLAYLLHFAVIALDGVRARVSGGIQIGGDDHDDDDCDGAGSGADDDVDGDGNDDDGDDHDDDYDAHGATPPHRPAPYRLASLPRPVTPILGPQAELGVARVWRRVLAGLLRAWVWCCALASPVRAWVIAPVVHVVHKLMADTIGE